MANITKEEFYKLISTLDDVEVDTMIILLECLVAGKSYKEAETKATDFLAMHPGKEKQIATMLEVYREFEAEHS